jgi:hypothetical protein
MYIYTCNCKISYMSKKEVNPPFRSPTSRGGGEGRGHKNSTNILNAAMYDTSMSQANENG